MISIQEMKKLRDIITDSFGVSPSVAGRVIGYYNGSGHGDIVAAMIKGDLSGVAPALDALGVNTPEKVPAATTAASDPVEKISTATGEPGEKISAKRSATARNASRGKEKKTSAQNTIVKDSNGSGAAWGGVVATPPVAIQPITEYPEHVQGDILEHAPADILPADTLPASINDDIENWLLDFSSKYSIDLEKCAGLQWRAACIYIGQRLKASGILIDREKQKRIGGTPYNPYKLEQLLYIWEHLTGVYKHVPLASDYIAFAGVSREWFYNSQDRSTSGQIDIAKKARAIEESALASALCDSRENPTGRIYYTKARLGWQETTTIQHVSVAASAPAAALPVFDSGVGTLPDKSDQ